MLTPVSQLGIQMVEDRLDHNGRWCRLEDGSIFRVLKTRAGSRFRLLSRPGWSNYDDYTKIYESSAPLSVPATMPLMLEPVWNELEADLGERKATDAEVALLGWPLRTLRGGVLVPDKGGTVPPADVLTRTSLLDARGAQSLRDRWQLVFGPVWSTLLATWGLLFLLLWLMLMLVKLPVVFGVRARRRHRGLCMVCGYDLSGIGSQCPECGRRVPGHSGNVHGLSKN